jgi:hypothetical protein
LAQLAALAVEDDPAVNSLTCCPFSVSGRPLAELQLLANDRRQSRADKLELFEPYFPRSVGHGLHRQSYFRFNVSKIVFRADAMKLSPYAAVNPRLVSFTPLPKEGDKGDRRGDPQAQPQLERAADRRQSISTKAHEHRGVRSG